MKRLAGTIAILVSVVLPVFASQQPTNLTIPVDAEDLGRFTSNRGPSPESGDCGGHTVRLWRFDGQIGGFITEHEGACEERPSPIFSRGQGGSANEIEFSAPRFAGSGRPGTSSLYEVINFSGGIENGTLTGTMTKLYASGIAPMTPRQL